MGKRPPAIYEPGELDRLRQKLGNLDRDEARRMAEKLGGQVGVERNENPPVQRGPSRKETVEVSVGGHPRASSARKPHRRIEPPEVDTPKQAQAQAAPKAPSEVGDDPSVKMRPSYRERLRMDRYAAQGEFEIKHASQVLYSMLSIFGEPADLVNPAFTTRRMNEYYARLESLVTVTRGLLPRNNVQRGERLRKESPFGYAVIDLIRQWNIERVASDLARLQGRPREATVADFSDILRAIYRPLYILGRLEFEKHIREAYRALYKVLLIENPVEAKEKHQAQVRTALAAYAALTKNIRFLLYPLLLKLLSDRWFSYDDFFVARRRKIAAFLGVTETDRLDPLAEDREGEEGEEGSASPDEEGAEEREEDEKEKVAAAAAEKNRAEAASRALARGLDSLEALFPEAGWRRLSEFPDLFPYFADVFELKKGTELIAPTDPMQQIVVFMHILEELFYGLRYVAFGTIVGPNGEPERVDEAMNRIIGGWHFFIEAIVGKEYLPRLGDYCRVIEGSSEMGTYSYTRRTLTELLWIKRLHFLPYLHFEYMMSAPPIRRPEDKPFYVEVRELRRLLTGVAAGIEAGMKLGGAARSAHCEGIDNPWEPYVFQIPNPLSIRLDALLGGKQSKRKTNAALVFFTLSVATVLDQLVNDENSWAYGSGTQKLFRSVNGDGVKPLFGVDEKVDADAIFERVLRDKASAAERKKE